MDILDELWRSRNKKECFIRDKILETSPEELDNVILYKKDNVIFFVQDIQHNILSFTYHGFLDVFQKEFDLTFIELSIQIDKIVRTIFKIDNYIIDYYYDATNHHL